MNFDELDRMGAGDEEEDAMREDAKSRQAAIEEMGMPKSAHDALKDAVANLGAELAMATNALPERRIASVMAAFRDLEKATDHAVSRML